MKIHIKTEYNKQSEVVRIIDTCMYIANGFFQSKRFILSPVLISGQPKVIYLPKISEISSIFKFAKKLKEDPIGNTRTEKQAKQFSDIDIQIAKKEEIARFGKEVKSLEKDMSVRINEIFGYLDINNLYITIKPTLFGTSLSFPSNVIKKGKDIYINYIWARMDFPVTNVIEGIISNLVGYVINNQKALNQQFWHDKNWETNEAIVDFLVEKTNMSELAKKYKPTIGTLRKGEDISNKIILTSKEYYIELGYPIKSVLVIENLSNLNAKEKEILTYLKENSNRIIKFEEIGNILFDSSKEYSLWAINKAVQRLREKLSTFYPLQLIHTIRKKGIVLYD